MSAALDGIAEFLPEFTGEIHPVAAQWRELTDEELSDLRASIATHGQRDPIWLTPDGVLLDGRHRLAICEELGIEPYFSVWRGEPMGCINSGNAVGRLPSAGERAMSIAVEMYDAGRWNTETERWRQGTGKVLASAKTSSEDAARCGQILSHDRDLAMRVLAGEVQLRAAYDQVQEAKRKERENAQRMEELRDHAPDLLDRVSPDFTLAMAYAAYQERDQERLNRERQEREFLQKHSQSLGFAISRLEEYVLSEDNLSMLDEALLDALSGYTITRERCESAIQALNELINRKGL